MIIVDDENNYYSSENGVLFNKDKLTLVQYPAGKENTSYTIPTGVTSIGNGAFSGCINLKSVTIPKGVKSIGESAFEDCWSLTSIAISNSVTSIGDCAFFACLSLKSITIPNSVTSISNFVFCKCSSLTSVTIPNTVKSIGEEAFYSCEKLKNVYYAGTKKQWQKISIDDENDDLTSAKIHYNYILDSQVKLSKTSYTYNGKAKKPSVTVKDAKGNKISSKYYTVTYSKGRKKVGKYTVKVTMKGKYSGTIKKTFKINPKGTSVSKLTAKSKGFTVKWKKQTTQTTGYQIKYSTSSKFKNAKTVTVKGSKNTSKTIKKLKSKKKYYVQIRTYKTVDGKKYYSSWSKAKTVTTKK